MSEADTRQRLAAILAADVAGYSRLMAADEHATVATLDACRAVFRKRIESNQGRVIDMAGDSVLAVFETAVGAVRASVEAQRELVSSLSDEPDERRMRHRIGVHLGDVIEKSDGSVYGDGVNIAARLQSLAEPGGIAVSQSVHNAVFNRVKADFEDVGEKILRNVPQPVRVFRIVLDDTSAAKSDSTVTETGLPLPERPSIAVLPFTNMSGDAEQEYFTDGITEDIITELSRFHSLFVIARNSTFTYKNKAVDVRTAAKQLGVRYVLEGSIRRAVNRVRVTAQLIDATTGTHIWGEKYDRVLEDIFSLQEELTRGIVSSIAPQIQIAELSKAQRRRPTNLSAYEVALRAWAKAMEAFANSDRALLDRVISEARTALGMDAECILALHALANAQWQRVFMNAGPDLGNAWIEGMGAAQRAVSLDASDSQGYMMRGVFHCYSGTPPGSDPRYDEALSDLRHAHELNSNDALVLLCLGFCEAVAGNPEKGIEFLLSSLRNNPRDLGRFNTMSMLSLAHFLAKDYANGTEWGRKATSGAPRLVNAQMFLALNYVGLGELAKARTALATGSRLSANFVRARLEGYSMYRRPEDKHRQMVFLRIASGLEDLSAADPLR